MSSSQFQQTIFYIQICFHHLPLIYWNLPLSPITTVHVVFPCFLPNLHLHSRTPSRISISAQVLTSPRSSLLPASGKASLAYSFVEDLHLDK
jgi:hypothetical protein